MSNSQIFASRCRGLGVDVTPVLRCRALQRHGMRIDADINYTEVWPSRTFSHNMDIVQSCPPASVLSKPQAVVRMDECDSAMLALCRNTNQLTLTHCGTEQILASKSVWDVQEARTVAQRAEGIHCERRRIDNLTQYRLLNVLLNGFIDNDAHISEHAVVVVFTVGFVREQSVWRLVCEWHMYI